MFVRENALYKESEQYFEIRFVRAFHVKYDYLKRGCSSNVENPACRELREDMMPFCQVGRSRLLSCETLISSAKLIDLKDPNSGAQSFRTFIRKQLSAYAFPDTIHDILLNPTFAKELAFYLNDHQEDVPVLDRSIEHGKLDKLQLIIASGAKTRLNEEAQPTLVEKAIAASHAHLFPYLLNIETNTLTSDANCKLHLRAGDSYFVQAMRKGVADESLITQCLALTEMMQTCEGKNRQKRLEQYRDKIGHADLVNSDKCSELLRLALKQRAKPAFILAILKYYAKFNSRMMNLTSHLHEILNLTPHLNELYQAQQVNMAYAKILAISGAKPPAITDHPEDYVKPIIVLSEEDYADYGKDGYLERCFIEHDLIIQFKATDELYKVIFYSNGNFRTLLTSDVNYDRLKSSNFAKALLPPETLVDADLTNEDLCGYPFDKSFLLRTSSLVGVKIDRKTLIENGYSDDDLYQLKLTILAHYKNLLSQYADVKNEDGIVRVLFDLTKANDHIVKMSRRHFAKEEVYENTNTYQAILTEGFRLLLELREQKNARPLNPGSINLLCRMFDESHKNFVSLMHNIDILDIYIAVIDDMGQLSKSIMRWIERKLHEGDNPRSAIFEAISRLPRDHVRIKVLREAVDPTTALGKLMKDKAHVLFWEPVNYQKSLDLLLQESVADLPGDQSENVNRARFYFATQEIRTENSMIDSFEPHNNL